MDTLYAITNIDTSTEYSIYFIDIYYFLWLNIFLNRSISAR